MTNMPEVLFSPDVTHVCSVTGLWSTSAPNFYKWQIQVFLSSLVTKYWSTILLQIDPPTTTTLNSPYDAPITDC